jgi:hypothetical protein
MVASRGGVIATVILCVVLGLYAILLGMVGLFIGFVSDSCGERGPCNDFQLEAAVLIGIFGPAVIAIVAMVIAIVRGVRHRALNWIIPIVGGVAATIVFYGAAILGYAAAGLNFFVQP